MLHDWLVCWLICHQLGMPVACVLGSTKIGHLAHMPACVPAPVCLAYASLTPVVQQQKPARSVLCAHLPHNTRYRLCGARHLVCLGCACILAA